MKSSGWSPGLDHWKEKNALMAARWKNFAKSGQKPHVYQFPCLQGQLCCLWERTYPWVGHTHTGTCSAQAHTSPGASDLRCPAMPPVSGGAADSGCSWCCCQRGLHCQPHIPRSNACVPAQQAGSRERCRWKPAQMKNNYSCSAWDTPWLSLPWVSTSAGDSAGEALGMCSGASLVPFGDSVKLDLCTWNPKLGHTGQT